MCCDGLGILVITAFTSKTVARHDTALGISDRWYIKRTSEVVWKAQISQTHKGLCPINIQYQNSFDIFQYYTEIY